MSIAYNAKVTMHEAKWTDVDGSTVTFKLPMTGMEGQRNPFEKFTKRRKGRAGTRFAMICYEIEDECQGPMVYKDEVMLAGWNDSQSNGHTVKFWLCADGMGHPFEGYNRKKDHFVVALVELDDDQETIDQKMRDRVEKKSVKPSQRPSYGAVMLCGNEAFWQYIKDIGEWESCEIESQADTARVGGYNDVARHYICSRLGITSRAELDRNEEVRQRYHEIIYKPFMATQEVGPGAPF